MNSIMSFTKKDNLIYNFDPRLKLLVLFFYIVLTWIFAGFTGIFILYIPLVIGWIFSKLSIRIFLKLFVYNLIFNGILFALSIFLASPLDTWTNLNPSGYPVYKETVIESALILSRLFLLLLAASLYTLTTDPSDISRSIKFYLKPLELMKIKTDSIALVFTLAIRFIPTLANEIKQVNFAQELKGSNFSQSNIFKKIAKSTNNIVPIFLLSFQYSYDLTESLESRGYLISDKHSQYHVYKLDWKDVLISFIMIAAFTIFIIMAIDYNNNLINKFLDSNNLWTIDWNIVL